MRKITLLTLFMGCCLREALAQYFIQYDPACMDKLEYRLDDGAEGKNYISFRLNKSETEKYFFQVGTAQPTKPAKAVTTMPCQEAFLDEEAMNVVNEGRKAAYIVVNTAAGARWYAVANIAYVVTGENLLSFVGEQYTFASDLLTPYENLAAQDSRSQVYFIGTENLYNKMVYHFRVEPLAGGTSVVSRTFRYAPHIGIISETVVEGGAEHPIDLMLVNGKTLEEYFTTLEDKLPIVVLQDPPAETTTPPVETTVPAPKNDVPASTTTAKPANTGIKVREADAQGIYEVVAGDNLYSISRSFGITLGQLRAWNQLVSDDILPGSKLLIKAPPKVHPKASLGMKGEYYEIDPGKAVPIPADLEEKIKKQKAERLKGKGEEKYSSEEAKARAVLAKGGTEAQLPLFVKREKDSGLHIVQKGETVAYMSKKYKMTEAKFRSINGLAATEAVRTGQVVKIAECVCEEDKSHPEAYSNHTKRMHPKGGHPNKKFYIAKEGETLYSIAKKHGLSVEKLRQYNHLGNNDLVAPKQKLFLE